MSQVCSNSHQKKEELSDFTVTGVIGTGSFGTCYRVKETKTNKYYVFKAVDYGSMDLPEKELLVTEVNLMKTLKHKHIVQYFGRIVHKSSGTLYIIMEWCEKGDLGALIRECKTKCISMNEKFIWKVLYQTAKALEACHSLLKQVTVLHRDIKPANIFLDKDYNVKLGDFGLAKILQPTNFSSTIVGTPYYMSPEQIHGSKYNKKSDVWSLGCLIYELCCLSQPFSGCDLITLRDNIVKNRLSRIPSVYSDYLYKIIKLLLSSNHESRPSVDVIIHHPTVICNYEANSKPFESKSRCVGNGDAAYPSTDLCDLIGSEFNTKLECTNDVYNHALTNQLKLLRKKESVLKAKEDALKTRELLLMTKETKLECKQKQIEQREREIMALQRDTTRSTKSIPLNRKSKIDQQFHRTTCNDSTFLVPTAAKLDPAKIIRPVYFQRVDPKSSEFQESEKQSTRRKSKIPRQTSSVVVENSEVAQPRREFNYLEKKYQNLPHQK